MENGQEGKTTSYQHATTKNASRKIRNETEVENKQTTYFKFQLENTKHPQYSGPYKHKH